MEVGIERPGKGGRRRAIRVNLRDVCLRAITVVCERITGGGGDEAVCGTKRVGRPSRLFGVRTTDSIHGTLDGLIDQSLDQQGETDGGKEPSSCQDQSRKEDTGLQMRPVCRPLREEREESWRERE
jgi:hypothetical protein